MKFSKYFHHDELKAFKIEYKNDKELAQTNAINQTIYSDNDQGDQSHLEKINQLEESLQQNLVYNNSRLTNIEEKIKMDVDRFESKLKNAYIFAGIAVLIVIIQFVVIFITMIEMIK